MARFSKVPILTDVENEWVLSVAKPLLKENNMDEVRRLLNQMDHREFKNISPFLLYHLGEKLYFSNSEEIYLAEFRWGGDDLVDINIPFGIKKIEKFAFSGCDSLKKVTLPESLIDIGGNAFSGCDSLTQITIPEGVVRIGMMAFQNCGSLSKVDIPQTVTRIGQGAFWLCDGLKNVIIPKDCSIGSGAFSKETKKIKK